MFSIKNAVFGALLVATLFGVAGPAAAETEARTMPPVALCWYSDMGWICDELF